MVRRSFASLGRSLNVRLVLPRAVNRPHMARIAVILASGKNFRPGIQSSGRAQYTTKKPLSQKKAILVGSEARKGARRPVAAGGGRDGGFFVTAPQFPIAQQHDHRLSERTRIVSQNNVAAVMNIQSFGPDGGGNDGLAGGHGFVDLQTRTASDAQGHDDYGGLAQMLDDRGHTSGDFDGAIVIRIRRIRGPLLNPAVGIAAYDTESRDRK